MTIKVNNGGAIIPLDYEDTIALLNVSLRVLTDYHIGTDTMWTRIDVLLPNNQQYNVTIVGNAACCDPNYQAGQPIRPDTSRDLMLPSHLRREGRTTGSRVNHIQLIEALRGLADVIEREMGK